MQRLRGNSNIISLVDSEVDLDRRVIYMVMEHGEIDLNTMLQRQRAAHNLSSSSSSGDGSSCGSSSGGGGGGGGGGMVGNLSVNFIRLTWMNLLEAVHAIHGEFAS